VDLGAVRRADDDVSAIWGPIGYQAPEVPTSGTTVASDLYTVGRSLAVLALDFRGFSKAYVESLPDAGAIPLFVEQESFHRLLKRACHRDPDRRFDTAAEFAEQSLGVLRQVLADQGNPAPPVVSRLFTGERGAFGHELGQVEPGRNGSTAARLSTVDFDGRAIAAALPVPQVDPTDPATSVILATGGDLAALLSAADQVPDGSSGELPLAVIRARIAEGDLDTAREELRRLATEDPFDWRVDWYTGLLELAAERPKAALRSFEAVYAALPGELPALLAYAVATEWAGEPTAALGYYQRVWRADRSYVSAAFGQARILLAGQDRVTAISALDGVPGSHAHHHSAQIAATRAQITAAPRDLVAADLVAAAERVKRLKLDVERRAGITVELLDAARAWVGHTGRDHQEKVFEHRLTDRELRLGLERAYRELAKVADDPDTRIALIDRANRVRPRTWL
jgi:serine/threonine-protein kinase PknG